MMRILLVDDQKSLRRSLALMLQSAGFETAEAASGQAALSIMERTEFDLVITDLKMEKTSGIDLLREIKSRIPELPVIIITAYGSIDSAVDAMRLGAFDYLTKPFGETDIIEKIRSCQAMRSFSSKRDAGEGKLLGDLAGEDMVAHDAQMSAVLIRVQRLSRTDISVLITGETGTGKTRIARLIHEKSDRRTHPFVSVNCASVPEQLLESELFGHSRGSFTGAVTSHIGLFEKADKGTIFLDEIDTLSSGMQAKLLSVLQERTIRPVGSNKSKSIDVRVVSASNQDIGSLIKREAFRSDLYFRINGIRLHLPALRDRGEDMQMLLDKFLQSYGRKYGRSRLRLTPEAMAYVLAYPYPGNIRQLENMVEQMVVFADAAGTIGVEALPEDLLSAVMPITRAPAQSTPGGGLNIAESERQLIESALRRCENISNAAQELGMARTTLWRRMKQYKLEHVSVGIKRR